MDLNPTDLAIAALFAAIKELKTTPAHQDTLAYHYTLCEWSCLAETRAAELNVTMDTYLSLMTATARMRSEEYATANSLRTMTDEARA